MNARAERMEAALREIKRLESFPVNDWKVKGHAIYVGEDETGPLIRDHAASPQSLALIADALNWMVKRRKLNEIVDAALAASVAEPDGLKSALRWALREGRKGFYTVSEGAGVFYHCRFCHAVSENPDKLNHEDACEYFHAKKEAQ